MLKMFSEKAVVVNKREARVSDISGREIPSNLHWGAVTVIECAAYDHGAGTSGNTHQVFCLDLMPEEMAEFRAGIDRLIESLRSKYRTLTDTH